MPSNGLVASSNTYGSLSRKYRRGWPWQPGTSNIRQEIQEGLAVAARNIQRTAGNTAAKVQKYT